jgi:hypothetical protein
MIKSAPVVALIAAFASSSEHAAAEPAAAPIAQATLAHVSQALRDAQVELFCDHRDGAVHLLREARGELLETRAAVMAPGVREIDTALWHVRHDDTHAAVAQLDTARSLLQG